MSITTSIHGDETVHDSLTQMGSYKKTYANINRLVSNGIPVSIHMVIMRKNYNLAEYVVQEAIKSGVRKVTFQTLVPRGRGAELISNDEDKSFIREKLKELYYLKDKYKEQIIIHYIDLYEKYYYVLETDGALYLEKTDGSNDVLVRRLI